MKEFEVIIFGRSYDILASNVSTAVARAIKQYESEEGKLKGGMLSIRVML